jgi:soluble lytic murein transglycosylase
VCAAPISVANEPALVRQRELFVEARQALSEGDRARYQELLGELQDYPLLGYLHYEDLRGRFDRASDEELQSFLDSYGDAAVSARLRSAWLQRLAGAGSWVKFLAVYRGGQSTEIQCERLQALLDTGRREAALEGAEALWMVGHSQPAACDPAFSAWRKAGLMTQSRLWERIRLAVAEGQWSLVSYLSGFLPSADRQWVEHWRRVAEDPWEGLDQAVLESDAEIARQIVAYGIGRLAIRDAQSAHDRWERIKGKHPFPSDEAQAIERTIALRAAYQHHPRALEWLTAVASQDAVVGAWRVRAALWAQDWERVLASLRKLSPAERQEEQWRYWEGRALGTLGEHAEADRLLGPLARTRDYYGFLAADRLGLPYALENHPIAYTERELDSVESMPGITRARELFMVGMTVDARREWRDATAELSPRQLQLAAVLARRWGWVDRAILTVARSEHFDDLALRFPLAHKNIVLTNASRLSLDPAWVYGILRQESAFWTDARSSAGAIGLMQLMPSTAAEVARRLNDKLSHPYELLDPARNIQLGSAYLKRVLERFNGHEVLASAAYNAGPRRVARWLPEGRPLSADVWVETLPLRETRDYVERVMEYTAVYDNRLGQAFRRLSERMPPVPPESLALTEQARLDKMP